MRRPPPLPASADRHEEPDEKPRPSDAARSPQRGRVADEAPEGNDAKVTEPLPDLPRIDEVGQKPIAGGARTTRWGMRRTPGAAPDGMSPGETPAFTTADVWRAARARRRALRAEIRRFTQRSRRRRMIWWGSVGGVLAVVLGSVVVAYSPLFAVEQITVAGADTLDPDAVATALEGQVGTPLALVDRSEVKAALVGFPLIETYSVEVRPPNELLIRVVERTPIGVVKTGAGYSLVDAAGVVLSTTSQRPDGVAVLDISGGTDSEAFTSAGLVMRSLPADLRAKVTTVTASSVDDVTLTLEGDRTVTWGNAEQSARKAYTLDKLVEARPDAGSYDVSSPDVAVVG